MDFFAERLKGKLIDSINDVVDVSWLFVRRPGRDMTRKRKISMFSLFRFVLSMGGASLNRELLRFFEYDTTTPTTVAFIKQRQKILPEAFAYLFRNFTDKLRFKKWRGYRLFAVDGSDISSCANASDDASFFRSRGYNGYNITHLNALYDLHSRLYVDYAIQPRREISETSALIEMVDRLKCDRGIIMADRNYESYNVFKHIEAKGLNYVIRAGQTHEKTKQTWYNTPKGDLPQVKIFRNHHRPKATLENRQQSA